MELEFEAERVEPWLWAGKGLIDFQSANHICVVRASECVSIPKCVFSLFVDTSRKLSQVSINLKSIYICIHIYIHL